MWSGLERAQASLLKALHYFCRFVTRNHTFGCCVSRPKRLSRCWWLVAIGDTVHIHGFGYRSLTLAYPYAAPHTRYSSAMTSSSNIVLANQPTGENRIMVFEDALARIVPPGTSRFEAGAANVSALEALASNTGGDEIDVRFASSHLTTSTLMKQVSPSTVERRQLGTKQPLRFWLPKIRLAKQSLHTLCPRRAWTRRTIL